MNFLETDSFREKIITPGRRRLLENSKKIILIGILIRISNMIVIYLLVRMCIIKNLEMEKF